MDFHLKIKETILTSIKLNLNEPIKMHIIMGGGYFALIEYW